MQNQKLYILKGNIKNPSWELRNQDVLVKKSDKEGRRHIQFVPGADSIWKHENEKQGQAKSLWFTNGSLAVNADDIVKIEFIETHPDFKVKYELFDPEAKSAAEYKQLQLIEKARTRLRQIADDEDKMSATAASLFGAESMNWGPETTMLRCYKYAEAKPKETIDALDDPAAEAKYIAALGIRKGVVESNPQKTAVVWNDTDRGVICAVPSGQKPLTVLGEFLYSEKNISTLQEIGKRLEVLEGNKKTGKNAGKKTA